MAKMKIVEVIQSLAAGGAERLAVDLSNELSKTEDVTLLILKEVEHFYLPQVSKRVKVVEAHLPLGCSVSQMWQCLRMVQGINPDVVHVHCQARYTMLLANLLLGVRYRFFMTVHSDVESQYSKGISGLQVCLSGHLGRCKFITISDYNYNQFCKCHSRLKQKKIPNGRSLPTLTEALGKVREEMDGYRMDDKTVLFIHVARYHPCKNQKLLVEVFNKLIEEGKNVSLVVIGNNFDQKEGEKLKKTANSRIHFLGLKTNVYDYMSCADAFCLSSDYEGMPMTLIEAMLSGLPLVSTPVCGAVDVISDGKNGFLSKSHDKEDYIEAVNSLLENFEAVAAYAMQYKDSCPYTIEACAKEYLKWFTEVRRRGKK